MPCSFCGKDQIAARGWCRTCYSRWQRSGTVEFRKKGTFTICTIEGCETRAVAKGLCEKHRTRKRRHGDPLASTRPDDWGLRTSHPRYKTWQSLVRRCHDPKSKGYADYGARGISVCEAWREDFWQFLKDTGDRPSPRHTLDRKDNDGNYEPGNVRWATPSQQARNKRSTVISEKMALEILRRSKRGEMTGDIARSLKLNYDAVWATITRAAQR
jgi:hypothetical protein